MKTVDGIEEKRQQYLELCHAMQTGVAFKMEKDSADTTPKHLRVGVNSSMSNHSALVYLLVQKGIITEDEYYDAMILAMQREVETYRTILEELYGAAVTLI